VLKLFCRDVCTPFTFAFATFEEAPWCIYVYWSSDPRSIASLALGLTGKACIVSCSALTASASKSEV
jgi:hypothetical protein